VIVELGGNDRETDPSAYLEDMRRLVALVGKPVIWIGPPSSNAARAPEVAAAHDRTARMQKSLRSRAGVKRWVDSRPFTRSNWAPDGVHFTRDGYNRWSTKISKTLEGVSPYFVGGLIGLVWIGAWSRYRRR
jgi:lysophospholipase L1-like esterase